MDEYKFCPECGTKLSKDTRFCPNCGTKQPVEAGTAEQPSSEEVQPSEDQQSLQESTSVTTSQSMHVNEDQEQQQTFFNPNSGTVNQQTERVEQNLNNPGQTREQFNQNYQQQQQYHQYNQQFHNYNYEQTQRRNNWRPYNESGQPGLINSFNVWLKCIKNGNGCMGRADYWWGVLGVYILQLVASFILNFCYGLYIGYENAANGTFSATIALLVVLGLIGIAFSVLISIIEIFAIVERLHDTGHSGWNFLWCFTIIGVFYVLYLLCQPTNWNEKRWVRING